MCAIKLCSRIVCLVSFGSLEILVLSLEPFVLLSSALQPQLLCIKQIKKSMSLSLFPGREGEENRKHKFIKKEYGARCP
uniref:Uncharacterized protein n=1 Tax=Poecilia latipinna TaxID=48699 RepID=A0A3B3TUP9_9TELE